MRNSRSVRIAARWCANVLISVIFLVMIGAKTNGEVVIA